jgi:molybdate transport system ATP-binding protein
MIRFSAKRHYEGFSLDAAFEAGPGITALFGPSGSGKSTIIRLMAGLENPDQGQILLDGAVLSDQGKGVFLAAHKRRIGLVFQDGQLFPHLSVRANLLYGRFFTKTTDRRFALEAVVETLAIGHLLKRRPGHLSGGEKQRVAMGRAILMSPRLLLMDEPLASLDEARKQEIIPFIARLAAEFSIPILYVSHSRDEVMQLASDVIMLAAGQVVATGRPGEVL